MSLPQEPDEGPPLAFDVPRSTPIEVLGELADRIGVSVATLVVGIAGAVGGVGVIYWWSTTDASPPPELTIPYAEPASAGPTAPTEAAPAPTVTVHAAGAVRHPGVYVLGVEARVGDLLNAAGGPVPDADLDRVNLAAPLVDGARVYVPSVGEDRPPPVVAGGDGGIATGPPGSDAAQLVDLNRASTSELERLPGIGPATAGAIVDHRERHGPFRSVDDLLSVRGIGEAKLAALRDLVHV